MSSKLLLQDISDDKEVVAFCHATNAATWGSKLYSTEQYIQREKHLGNQTIASNPCIEKKIELYRKYLGIKYFVLKDLSLPETDKCSQIVSSFETLNRVGYIRHPSFNKEIPILSVCIGGVYTPEKFRGKGYASSMMTEFNKILDDIVKKNSNDSFLKNAVSFLYSEVGNFYEKFGYKSFHVPIHYFENKKELLHYAENLSKHKEVQPLILEEVSTNLSACIDEETKECDKYAKSSSFTDKYKFYIKPQLDIYKWFKARDDYIAKIAFPEVIKKHPLIDGYKIKDSKSHIIWHHNWNEEKLYVLKLFIEKESREDLINLLKKALEELAVYNINKLAVWDSDFSSKLFSDIFENFKNQQGVHMNCNNDSLSAIRADWIEDIDDLEWINNSKYIWF
ncbi:hypothetical protein QEN19_000115 [Hanseniaspora menglaensis]